MFKLDARLQADTELVCEWSLSLVLLSRDANYPWCILVPRRKGIREVYELDDDDRAQLLLESCHLSETLMTEFDGEKCNVAALGNMVPQLHLHHIVRYSGDPAWPGPVWGAVPAKAYTEDDLVRRLARLQQALGEL